MSQIAAINPSTAPRDLQELVRTGRFQIRKLAEELKLLDDPQNKVAFMSLATEAQAQQVLTALKELDKGTNGTANGAAHAPAEAAKPSGIKRTPANKGLGAGAETAASPATAPSGAPFSIAPLMEALKETNGRLDAILSNQAVLFEKLDALSGLAAVSTATALLVGETALNAARADILSAALEDVGMVVKEVGDAMGKAKK